MSGTAAYKLLTTAVCEGPVVINMVYDVIMEDGRRVTLKSPDTIPMMCEASKYLKLEQSDEKQTITISLQPTVGEAGRLGFPRVLGPASIGRREHLDLRVPEQEVGGEEGDKQSESDLDLAVDPCGDYGQDDRCDRGAAGGQEQSSGCEGEAPGGRAGRRGGVRGGADDAGGGGDDHPGGGGDDHPGGGGGDQPGAGASPEDNVGWDPEDDGLDPEPGSSLHHLSVEGRRLWEAVLHPEQLSYDQIQEITKLSRTQFFQLCRETEEASRYSGHGPRLQLSHQSRVLVFFLREVKKVSFRYIGGRFQTSRKVVTTSFLDILFFIFLRHPCIPCLWNDTNMTASKLNDILDSLTAALSPAKRDFVAKFRDAQGRRITFVTDDGTSIPVQRSADAGLTQVTDSGGKGGMNKGVCFLMAVTVNLDGTIVGVRPGPAISGGRRAGD